MDSILFVLLIATAILFIALTIDDITRRTRNPRASEPAIKREPEDGRQRKAA